MGKGSRVDGARNRRRILEELVRRWETMQPEPSAVELANLLDLDRTSVRAHVVILRRAGYIHQDGLVVTPAGYREIRGANPLTQ